jgi:hypothetical protein
MKVSKLGSAVQILIEHTAVVRQGEPVHSENLAIKSEWNYEEGQTTMRRTARVTLSEAEARELLAWLREWEVQIRKGADQ